jgi:hypothetical protein
MDIADVMDQVATAIDTITGLRVSAYPAGEITPPAAIVSYPESVTFDATYGRGMDRMSLPVVVLIGVPNDRQTRDLLTAYCAGSGASSVKAAIESGSYTALHTIRVEGIDFDVHRVGATDYMAALFTCDIAGPGTA